MSDAEKLLPIARTFSERGRSLANVDAAAMAAAPMRASVLVFMADIIAYFSDHRRDFLLALRRRLL